MTVVELMKLLQKLPANLPVVMQSYEGGVDPVTEAKTKVLKNTFRANGTTAIYDEVTDSPEKALLISFKFNRADRMLYSIIYG